LLVCGILQDAVPCDLRIRQSVGLLYTCLLCAAAWNLCIEKREIMSSLYIAECDGSGIVELLVKKVKEMVTTGIKYSV